MKKINLLKLIVSSLLIMAFSPVKPDKVTTGSGWNEEIIYHVFQRSFYDSNGDHNGDLNGLVQKLGYLKELGVTTILCTPLYESDFYHNYFAKNYDKIDPEYGTMDDYLNFVKAVHRNGLKFIMDMETQYAQNGNDWFTDSYKNPKSPYSDFISYSDSTNRYADQMFMPLGSELNAMQAWPDQKLNIVYLNLNSKKVKDWTKMFYAHWVDPNGDGKFDDGVDGFRIDHMMDDLDNKQTFKNMFVNFWSPVFKFCREINPALFVVGEQSNWAEYGEDMIVKGEIDASFGFPIYFSITGTPAYFMNDSIKKALKTITKAENIGIRVQQTIKRIPQGKYYINFIENHDTERFASIAKNDPGKIECGAVLNILLPGIPSVYYGQELGVTGKIGDWGYDVNHIPVREAFPWTPNKNDAGMAIFYKGSGPWWDQSYLNTGESSKLALSVQQKDPSSLWNLYHNLIRFRKENPAIKNGSFNLFPTGQPDILAFSREYKNEKVLVMMNISESPITVKLPTLKKFQFQGRTTIKGDSLTFHPYGFMICRDY